MVAYGNLPTTPAWALGMSLMHIHAASPSMRSKYGRLRNRFRMFCCGSPSASSAAALSSTVRWSATLHNGASARTLLGVRISNPTFKSLSLIIALHSKSVVTHTTSSLTSVLANDLTTVSSSSSFICSISLVSAFDNWQRPLHAHTDTPLSPAATMAPSSCMRA